MNMATGIVGVGAHLPMLTLTNDQIAAEFGKPGEWIEWRTGICRRHVAGAQETVPVMAAEAARKALRDAGLDADQVSLIVVASSTPGRFIPSVACGVQRILKAHHAIAMDVNAACAGFIYAMHVALALRDSGRSRGPALIIGSERFSRHIDYEDRATASLFGDGAGAVVLDDVPQPYGFLSTALGSDGSKEEYVRIVLSDDRSTDPYTLMMDGPATRAFIEEQLPFLLKEATHAHGLSLADIDLVIPHQANMNLINAVLARANVDQRQTWYTGHRYGNTGAASVPITLDSARLSGRLTDGATVLLAALGAGMTWGTALLRWRSIPDQPSRI